MSTRRKRILFLVMGWKVPSSKFRVLAYLPFFEEAGWDYRIVAGGTGLGKKRDILRRVPDFDLVFIQKKLFDPLFLKLLKRRNPNIVFDFDDALFAYEPTGKPLRIKKPGTAYTKHLLNLVLGQAAHVIAGNANLAEYAESFSRKLTIIPTPVNLSDYEEKTKKGESVVIGWLGTGRNLVYLKEIESVIQAVSKKFPKVEWRVLSNQSYSLDGVPIRNIPWDDDTAFGEISRFDIGLNPLFDDAWSRGKCAFKALQYMAAGVPVVASPVGMNTEIVTEGETGYLAGYPEKWVDALTALIKNENLRCKLGRNGRRYVEKNFSVEMCWNKLKDVLESQLYE